MLPLLMPMVSSFLFYFIFIEVGAKCVCDVCHVDISTTLYINCAECSGIDLCISCFSSGAVPSPASSDKTSENSYHIQYHHQPSHTYYVKVLFFFDINIRNLLTSLYLIVNGEQTKRSIFQKHYKWQEWETGLMFLFILALNLLKNVNLITIMFT